MFGWFSRFYNRFISKVETSPNGCWMWTGANSGQDNYGVININGKSFKAHRAWAGRGKTERNMRSPLSEHDVREVRRLRSEGLQLNEIAKLYNVSKMTVHNIATLKTWGHVK